MLKPERAYVLAAFCLLVFVLVFAGNGIVRGNPSGGGSVAGKVFDAQEPASAIEGVLVQVALLENGQVVSIVGEDTTDEQGEYVITGLPSEEYGVAAFPDEESYWLHDIEWSVTVESPHETIVDFPLQAGGKISGQVTDSGEEPLLSAYVAVVDDEGNVVIDGPVDEAGDFTLKSIPGSYRVYAEHGNTRQYYNGKDTAGNADLVDIAAFVHVENIDFVLDVDTNLYVSGTVFDENESLMPGVEVFVYSSGDTEEIGADITGQDGTFRIAVPDEGTYDVIFVAEEYETLALEGVQVAGESTYDPWLTVTLYPPEVWSVITGVVEDGDGEFLPGVAVRIKLSENAVWEEPVFTGTNGAYELNVAVGKYYDILFEKAGYRPVLLKDIEAEEEGVEIDVIMSDLPGITGIVTDSDSGASIQGVSVEIWRTDVYLSYETTTGTGGSYGLYVPDGVYSAEFRHNDYQTLFVDDIVVDDGAVAELDVQMVPGTGLTVALSVDPENAGTVTGAGSYGYAELVTIEAVPATGYQFLHWTEGGAVVSTDTSYTFNIENDRNMVAHFEATRHTVTTDVTPESSGVTGGCGSFDYGSEVTVTAEANEGFVFAEWLENMAMVSGNRDYTFVVYGDRELLARFWPVSPGTEVKDVNASPGEEVVLSFLDGQVVMAVMAMVAGSGIDGRIAVTFYDSVQQLLGNVDTPSGMVPVGLFWQINRTEDITGSSIRIEVIYDPDKLPEGVSETSLRLHRYNTIEEKWDLLPEQGIDAENSMLWAMITDFSVFGVFGTEYSDPDEEGGQVAVSKIELPRTWGDVFSAASERDPFISAVLIALVVLLSVAAVAVVQKKLLY